jgi:transcriptional regulator with XRE-family HTH domain
MATQIPSLRLIKRRLAGYTMDELQQLAEDSGVAFSTLLKIKLGPTKNPGIETVRAFWPHLKPEAPRKPKGE